MDLNQFLNDLDQQHQAIQAVLKKVEEKEAERERLFHDLNRLL